MQNENASGWFHDIEDLVKKYHDEFLVFGDLEKGPVAVPGITKLRWYENSVAYFANNSTITRISKIRWSNAKFLFKDFRKVKLRFIAYTEFSAKPAILR